MNPLYSGNINIQQIKNMMNAVRFAQNPQMALSQMAQSNPQIAEVLNLTRGKDLQSVFYDMCKQRNINPDEVLNLLR